jgi:hypothetical protein
MQKHFLASTTLALFVCSYAHAATPAHHNYSNIITAHNIAGIQNTITTNTFNTFGLQNNNLFNKSQQAKPETNLNLYGRTPMYGSELIYGEFNEDGSMGRSGGDSPFASLTNIWLDWHYTNDSAKFSNITPVKATNNLLSAGTTGSTTKMGAIKHNWGIYTNYTNSLQHTHEINIESQGGLFGVFNGFYYRNLALNTNITSGALNSSVDYTHNKDSFTNFWFSGAVSISYDIALDNSFILRPVINTEYTWIKSEDYTSATGDIINNENIGIFTVAPEIQAIKHIGCGWYGKLYTKHVTTFANGDRATVNNTDTINLNNLDYFEYAVSLEKSLYQTHISASLGRHDKDRYGWFGNINIKYLF